MRFLSILACICLAQGAQGRQLVTSSPISANALRLGHQNASAAISKYVASSRTRTTVDCVLYGQEFKQFLDVNFPNNLGLNTWSVYHETYIDGEGCGFDIIFDAIDGESSQSLDEFAKMLSEHNFFGNKPSVTPYLAYYAQ